MKTRLTGIICAVLFGVFGLYVFQVSVGPNILRLPGQSTVKPIINTVMPEGWAFFTKPADSSVVTVFAADGDDFDEVTSPSNAEPQWLFGLNRESRYQAFESASLLVGVGQEKWTPCDEAESNVECLDRIEESTEVTNNGNLKTLCGGYGLVAEGVIPWSYREFSDDVRIPREAIRLEVNCG